MGVPLPPLCKSAYLNEQRWNQIKIALHTDWMKYGTLNYAQQNISSKGERKT